MPEGVWDEGPASRRTWIVFVTPRLASAEKGVRLRSKTVGAKEGKTAEELLGVCNPS